jgi:hypothetical protein
MNGTGINIFPWQVAAEQNPVPGGSSLSATDAESRWRGNCHGPRTEKISQLNETARVIANNAK